MMAKRRRFGSIKRVNQRWRASYVPTINADRVGETFATQTEAEAWLAAAELDVQDQAEKGLARHGHGQWDTPEHRTWRHMKDRCLNPRSQEYALYGGRGITVCDRWLHSFENFLADMGPRPSREYSIDRIDNNGNYEPSNCRWATRSQQQANRRCSRYVEWEGRRLTIMELAAMHNLSADTLRFRLRRGWALDDALRPVALVQHICARCGASFEAVERAVYCSAWCRMSRRERWLRGLGGSTHAEDVDR